MPQLIATLPGGWILSKPPEWLTRPGSQPGRDDRPVLTEWIESQLGKPFLVHRLDAGTSGLLCVAANAETQARWSLAFQERKASKRYEAFARGAPPSSLLKASTPIDGKKAVTQIEVVKRWKDAGVFFASVRISTGRRHQIRKHLSELGFPILGDVHYGGPRSVPAVSLGIERVALHARVLELPGEGRFEAPWPQDGLNWMARLDQGV